MWRAVSRRRATSEPSTRNTRGSPLGALCAADTIFPGRKPSSMRRRALSSGRSNLSRTACSPFRSSASVARFPPGGRCFLVKLSCNTLSVWRRKRATVKCVEAGRFASGFQGFVTGAGAGRGITRSEANSTEVRICSITLVIVRLCSVSQKFACNGTFVGICLLWSLGSLSSNPVSVRRGNQLHDYWRSHLCQGSLFSAPCAFSFWLGRRLPLLRAQATPFRVRLRYPAAPSTLL